MTGEYRRGFWLPRTIIKRQALLVRRARDVEIEYHAERAKGGDTVLLDATKVARLLGAVLALDIAITPEDEISDEEASRLGFGGALTNDTTPDLGRVEPRSMLPPTTYPGDDEVNDVGGSGEIELAAPKMIQMGSKSAQCANPGCGKTLTQKHSGRNRITCSDKCRRQWNLYKRGRAVPASAVPPKEIDEIAAQINRLESTFQSATAAPAGLTPGRYGSVDQSGEVRDLVAHHKAEIAWYDRQQDLFRAAIALHASLIAFRIWLVENPAWEAKPAGGTSGPPLIADLLDRAEGLLTAVAESMQ